MRQTEDIFSFRVFSSTPRSALLLAASAATFPLCTTNARLRCNALEQKRGISCAPFPDTRASQTCRPCLSVLSTLPNATMAFSILADLSGCRVSFAMLVKGGPFCSSPSSQHAMSDTFALFRDSAERFSAISTYFCLVVHRLITEATRTRCFTAISPWATSRPSSR